MPICNLLASNVSPGDLVTDALATAGTAVNLPLKFAVTSNMGLIDAQYRNVSEGQRHRFSASGVLEVSYRGSGAARVSASGELQLGGMRPDAISTKLNSGLDSGKNLSLILALKAEIALAKFAASGDLNRDMSAQVAACRLRVTGEMPVDLNNYKDPIVARLDTSKSELFPNWYAFSVKQISAEPSLATSKTISLNAFLSLTDSVKNLLCSTSVRGALNGSLLPDDINAFFNTSGNLFSSTPGSSEAKLKANAIMDIGLRSESLSCSARVSSSLGIVFRITNTDTQALSLKFKSDAADLKTGIPLDTVRLSSSAIGKVSFPEYKLPLEPLTSNLKIESVTLSSILILGSSAKPGVSDPRSNVLSVGKDFWLYVGLNNNTPQIATASLQSKGELDAVRFVLDLATAVDPARALCSFSIPAAISAKLLNAAQLLSAANLPNVADSNFIVQTLNRLNDADVTDVYAKLQTSAAKAELIVALDSNQICLANSKLSVNGRLAADLAALQILTNLKTLPIGEVGAILELANSSSLASLSLKSATSGALKEFNLLPDSISAKSSGALSYLNLNIALEGTVALRFNSLSVPDSQFVVQGVRILPASGISVNLICGPRAGYSVPPPLYLFGIGGAVEVPSQLQEFARYPLPTATSKAQPLDEVGLPIYSTQTVFGMQTFVAGTGQPGSTSVSVRVNAVQLAEASQYPTRSFASGTLVFLRASVLDTAFLRRSIIGFDALGPNVSRVGLYSQFPRSYGTSVSSMNSASGTPTTLSSENTFIPTGRTWQFPTTPVLFLGSSLVRHNRSDATVASPERDVAIATDFYSSASASTKLAHSRIESTVGSYTETFSPTYSAASMRLFSPSKFQQFLQGNGTSFRIDSAIIPTNEDLSGTVQLHGSDSSISFIPIKSGVRHFYSNFNTSIVAQNLIFSAAEGLGGAGTGNPVEYTVLVTNLAGEPVSPSVLFTPGADCVLRLSLSPYSALPSSAYIDIPILGASENDPDRVVIDSGYAWFVSRCLPGGEFSLIHSLSCMKDLHVGQNSSPVVSTRRVLAFSSPQIVVPDQGQSSERILSFAGDRNLLMGQFSLAISRPAYVVESGVRINTEGSDFELLNADTQGKALAVSSFDVNSLHMFIKEDGTLAGRRVVPSISGPQVSTDLTPVLPKALRDYLNSGGKVSKIKLGESINAVLTTPIPSTGTTGRRLYLWGYNTFGHLAVPVSVDSSFLSNGYIADVKDFDFNIAHIAIVKDDGSLKSWGCKSNGTSWYSLYTGAAGCTPVDPAEGPMPIMDFAIGSDFAVAYSRKNDGESSVVNVLEQFGSYSVNAPTGVTLAAKSPIIQQPDLIVYAGKVLACGLDHSVALKSDGTVVCWGDDTYGQSSPPSSVTAPGSAVVAVDAGDNHCIALKSNGTVICWGRNSSGQATVPTGLNAKQIGAGGDFSVALRSAASTDVSATVGSVTDDEIEDTIAAWGDNSKLQCNVPKCEGLSYDPGAHKYRMRFWSVSCGWDHAVGLRKDDDQVKAGRDHLEITRYNSNNTKFVLKSSGNAVIFADLNFSSTNAFWYPVSAGNPDVSFSYLYSASQTSYLITKDNTVDPNHYYSSVVTVGGRQYRLKVYFVDSSSNPGAHALASFYIQHTTVAVPGPFDWQDLQVSTQKWNNSYLSWPPTAQTSGSPVYSNFSLEFIERFWFSLTSLPSWKIGRVDDYLTTYEFTTGANGEYFECDFSAVDTDLTAASFNKLHVAWGNPVAYSASPNPVDYQPYYPELTWNPANDAQAFDLTNALAVNLQADVSSLPGKNFSPTKVVGSYSYMGYGPQLGNSLLIRAYSQFFTNYLAIGDNSVSALYLGPTSIRISPKLNNRRIQVKTVNSNNEVTAKYGIPSIVTSSGVFFNLPTPVGASSLNLYASPDTSSSSNETQVFGFSKNAAYCERFSGALPSGFSIVANGDASIPAGTKNSLSGFHLLWSGTIPGVGAKTIVFTGAVYSGLDLGEPTPVYDGIVLPFDTQANLDSYLPPGAFGPEPYLDPAWWPTIGLDVRNVEIIKHQSSRGLANTYPNPAVAAKHITYLPYYVNNDFLPLDQRLYYVLYGLSPRNGSPEATSLNAFSTLWSFKRKDIVPFYDNRSMYFGYRSAFGLKDAKFYVATDSPCTVKGSVTSVTGGDLSLNSFIPLLGPFPYNSYLKGKGLCGSTLGKSWMMDVGQATVPAAASGYGFKSVSCAQFHTVAIDDQDSVLAWGSDFALKPTGTNRKEWNPYEFSGTGCSFGTTAIEHLVTGYFRGFFDSYATSPDLVLPSMTDDRSMSLFPAAATLTKAQLTEAGLFAYPDAPASGIQQDCYGNFSTGAMLLFDANTISLNDQQSVTLLEQMSSSSGAFKIAMKREDPSGYRIVASDKNNQNIKSTSYFPAPPRFIYIGLQEQGSDMTAAVDAATQGGQQYIAPGTTFSVKIDGEYLPWVDVQDPANQYVSGLVPSLRYSRFMHYVGQIQNGAQDASRFSLQSVDRKFMPTPSTPLTKFIAGDDYFCALYKDAAEDRNKVRGSLVYSSVLTNNNFTADFGNSFNAAVFGAETEPGNYGQGPFLKNIQDIVGPKNYFLSKVQRTYKKATVVTPSDTIYTSPAPTLATARYSPAFGSPGVKIYVGNTASDSNTVMDYNYNHSFADPANLSGDNSSLRVWPKVVFPEDPEYYDSSRTVFPYQISIYRNGFRIVGPVGTRYANNNTFTVDTYDPSGALFDTLPLAPLVNDNSVPELSSMDTIICYDAVTRRLLPQAYYPTANLSGNLTNISLGVEHTVAKTSTNSLVSLGSNLNGQRAFVKTLVDENTSVQKVVTNGYTTLVLKMDGTLAGGGASSSNILPIPADIPALKDVAIGGNIAVGIRADNDQLYVWGAYDSTSIPAGLGPCKKIACGYNFAAVITFNDRVVVFGDTGSGRGSIPTALQNAAATEVACTFSRVAARLASTGTVYWWGAVDSNGNPVSNGNGPAGAANQIGSTKDHFFIVNAGNQVRVPGSGTTQPAIVWNLVIDLPQVTTGTWVLGRGIYANHMVASNGTTTYGWGSNYKPEVASPGPGTEAQWTGQAFIAQPSDRIAVKVNPFNLTNDGPYNHVVVSVPSTSPSYFAKQIPDSIRARNEDFVYTSVELANLKHVVSMASAYDIYFAVAGDTINATQGSLLTWGLDQGWSALPGAVASLTDITKVSCRNSHVAALRSNGTAYVWGSSSSGAIPDSGTISGLLDVECGDNMTVGIRSADNKLVSFGRYDGSFSGPNTPIPEPFNSMKFSSISCGIDHVAGRLLEGYSVPVPGGLFVAAAGSAVSFGQNDLRQTELPGFKYALDNVSIVGEVVAGGKFTAFISASNGFNCFVPNSTSVNKGVMFINKESHEDLLDEPTNVFDSELIEGYMAHTSGYLCNQILPPTHSFYFNRPATVRTPEGEPYYAINCQTAYKEDTSRTTNAINIPASYRRGGSKKAKHIAAGRFKQWVHETGDHMFGAGYTIIVDRDTNAIEVVGGELIPNAYCTVENYPVPPHTVALKTVPGDELQDAVIAQVGTYRSSVYALKSLGQMVKWGYQDSAGVNSNVNYNVDTGTLRQYFSLPDVSMFDYTDKAKFDVPGNSLIGMSYVAGISGISDYWAVVVSLDRYFNGVKTNVRKFVATGDVTVTQIDKPVHFAETFSCVDTWPSGTATGLDTQYVMSVTPYYGVSCQINSASLFGMNLDSRLVSGQKVLLQPSDISNDFTAADYVLNSIDNTQLALAGSVSDGYETVSSVSEGSNSLALTTADSVSYPSYLKGRFGGTARTESLFATGSGAYTAGRIAQVINWEPGSANGDIALPLVWYKSTSLPTAGTNVTTWASGGSNTSAALAPTSSTTNPNRRPVSIAFNTSYKGAQFDKDASNEDDLVSSTLSLGTSNFTYFVVYNKTVSTSNYNLAFGKTYVAAGAGGNRVSGFGFHLGRPVLYYETLRQTATSTSAVTGNNIACAYYGSGSYNGIRINGAQIAMNAFEANVISTTAFTTRYNMSRPVVGFTSGGSTTYSYVDNNDIYAEVLAFEQILTPSQIQTVEGYLAHKFNLQANLPSDHPYRYATPGQDRLESLRLPLLSDNDLLSFESDKFTETSGLAQSWVGLFDVTVSHRGQRMKSPTEPANHHAPVLAEFDVKLNQTSTIFARVTSCKLAVAGSLIVDNRIKQLFGSAVFKLNTVAPELKTTFAANPILFKAFIPPTDMSLYVGMNANIDLKSKLSGANDCNTVYGCNGVSEFPPELYLTYRGYNPEQILTRLDVSAGLAKLVVVNYAKLSCRFAVAGDISQTLGLSGNISAAFKVQRIVFNEFRSNTVDLGYAEINGTTKTEICLSSVKTLLPRKPKYPTGGPPKGPVLDSRPEIIDSNQGPLGTG